MDLEQNYEQYFKLVNHRIREEFLPLLKNMGIDISGENKPALFRYVKKSLEKRIKNDELFFKYIKEFNDNLKGENISKINFSNLDINAKVLIDLAAPIKKILFFEHPEQCSLIMKEIYKEIHGADYNILEEIEKETKSILNEYRFDEIVSKKKRGYKKRIGVKFCELYKNYSTYITKSNYSKFVLPIIRDKLNIEKDEWKERKFIDYI